MTGRPIVLIGVDCACQAKDIGIARAEHGQECGTTVTDVLCGAAVASVAARVAEWVVASDRCLLALDAPLGWPKAMGDELVCHSAGSHIGTAPNAFFRRETDRNVQRRLGKTPLDVGADRIARTAHAALSLLDEVRHRTGLDIALAWNPQELQRATAIEVYPAGTLLAHGLPAFGYKKPVQRDVRGRIVQSLSQQLVLPGDLDPLLDDADCLDAVLCVLAAADFVDDRSVPPDDPSIAQKEGWIWVRAAPTRSEWRPC
jgi:hypothetical protein